MLVTHPLTGESFCTWKHAMKMALNSRNKICFADKTIAHPPENDDRYHLWLRNKNIVVPWLLNSIWNQITSTVIYTPTACDIWTDLEECFQQFSRSMVFAFFSSGVNSLNALWDLSQ
jgi:hypothetical protein